MKKRLFMFVTPDGVTYSSPEKEFPDVENFQILGYGEGTDEEEAFNFFIQNNNWIFNTDFENVICIEVKSRIFQGKKFVIKRR